MEKATTSIDALVSVFSGSEMKEVALKQVRMMLTTQINPLSQK